jgi:hypothetical protein
MITQSKLHELFEYRDGDLYWKKQASNRVTIGARVGFQDSSGYRAIRLTEGLYRIHRLIFLMHNGWLPVEIDHKDKDKLNNTLSNLRATTKRQNQYNTTIRKDSTTGIKGVIWATQNKKWRVQVRHSLGRFSAYIDDLDLAELVAIEARNKFHGEFARHN